MTKSLLILLLAALPAFAGDSGIACIYSAAKSGRKGVAEGRAGMANLGELLPDRLWLPSSLDYNTSAGVNQWRSMTTNANTKIQTATADQPAYSTHNGVAMARFDGTSDYLEETSITYSSATGVICAGIYAEGPGGAGGAVVSVARIEVASTLTVLYFTYNGTDPGSAGFVQQQAGVTNLAAETTNDFDCSDAAYALTWGSRTGGSGSNFVRVDAVEETQTIVGGVDDGEWFDNVFPNTNNWNFGALKRSSGTGGYFDGYLGGVACWTNTVPSDGLIKHWERFFAALMGKQIYP